MHENWKQRPKHGLLLHLLRYLSIKRDGLVVLLKYYNFFCCCCQAYGELSKWVKEKKQIELNITKSHDLNINPNVKQHKKPQTARCMAQTPTKHHVQWRGGSAALLASSILEKKKKRNKKNNSLFLTFSLNKQNKTKQKQHPPIKKKNDKEEETLTRAFPEWFRQWVALFRSLAQRKEKNKKRKPVYLTVRMFVNHVEEYKKKKWQQLQVKKKRKLEEKSTKSTKKKNSHWVIPTHT